MLNLDEATIYQIFFQYYAGTEIQTIAHQLGVTRNTVATHLTWSRAHLYSERLLRRIRPLRRPRAARKHPEGFIAMEEASYFFPHRPSPREIATVYCRAGLKSTFHNRQRLTRREWILDFLDPPELEGVFLTETAFKILGGTHPAHTVTVKPRPGSTPRRLIPTHTADRPIPDRALRRALAIQDWTGLPYATLTLQDVV